MKSKKRKIGDSGIRLKPNESNILENYTKHRKRVRKTKKKKQDTIHPYLNTRAFRSPRRSPPICAARTSCALWARRRACSST